MSASYIYKIDNVHTCRIASELCQVGFQSQHNPIVDQSTMQQTEVHNFNTDHGQPKNYND